MRAVLLIDFGSTYTKLAAVDLDSESVIGKAQHPSTVETDITIGLEAAMRKMEEIAGHVRYIARLACSSAAGGLRMVTIGLVPDLTAEAAQRAALGAGAKVVGTFAHRIQEKEVRAIEELSPDIILLAGGTDGGNRDVIIHNARRLAKSRTAAPVVMAGNKEATEDVTEILRDAGKTVIETENVMPEVGVLNVEPARETIRRVFIERITKAKGLARAKSLIDDIVMPTPTAVLKAADLLSRGADSDEGLGDLLVVDVGGATTDIHSVGDGLPSAEGVVYKGLPEPRLKRTVEGDLGIRYNALSILEAVGPEGLGINRKAEEIKEAVQRLARNVETVARTPEDLELDEALASAAVRIAISRHVGHYEPVFMPHGQVLLQFGKDCTGFRHVIATGGIFVHHPDPLRILHHTLYSPETPMLLKPKAPRFLIDSLYILYAVGLLERVDAKKAFTIGKRYLREVAQR